MSSVTIQSLAQWEDRQNFWSYLLVDSDDYVAKAWIYLQILGLT